MKCLIYVRQSLDRTGQELGVQRQEAECRRVAEARGYEVVDVVVDNSVSAFKGHRAGYTRVLEALESQSVSAVVVYRLDRLLRRMTDLEALIELCERTGAQVATVQGDLDLTNSSGRLLGRILASVARAEVETKSERHKLANAQKAMQGKPHGSRRPYGYESDLVTIRESEATILRAFAKRYLDGWGYKDIAYWANEQGYRTTTGKLWYPITVRNMLRKKRYGGIREYNGVEYQAVWEAVFDAQTWERLNLVRKPNKPLARKYLLTGLVVCGKCGTYLNGATKRDKPERPLRRTYHCRVQGDTQRERGCGGVVRNADALEHFVTRCLFYRLENIQIRTDGELTYLLNERKLLTDRINALVDDYATGLLTRAELKRAKVTAESALADVETAINAQSRSDLLQPDIQSVWESKPDSWKREVLSLLIKRIVVNPGITKPFYRVGDTTYRFDPNLIEIEWLH